MIYKHEIKRNYSSSQIATKFCREDEHPKGSNFWFWSPRQGTSIFLLHQQCLCFQVVRNEIGAELQEIMNLKSLNF